MDREELMAAMRATAERKPVPVTTPWGPLFLKSLTVAEVQAQSRSEAPKDPDHIMARGLASVLCDENGARYFDPDDAEHIALIMAQSWADMQPVVQAANELNATSKKGADDQGNG